MELDEIESYVNMLKEIYNQQLGALNQLEADRDKREKEYLKLIKKREDIELEKELLCDVVQEARKSAKDTLQYLSTSALQFIMGNFISVEVELDDRGAEFLVRSEYEGYSVETDPAGEEGGGVADIVSSIAQLGLLSILESNNFAPAFLDEPSKYVSASHSEAYAKFLFDISASTERQTIMVTHDPLLAKMGNKSYHFQLEEGRTVVRPL